MCLDMNLLELLYLEFVYYHRSVDFYQIGHFSTIIISDFDLAIKMLFYLFFNIFLFKKLAYLFGHATWHMGP